MLKNMFAAVALAALVLIAGPAVAGTMVALPTTFSVQFDNQDFELSANDFMMNEAGTGWILRENDGLLVSEGGASLDLWLAADPDPLLSYDITATAANSPAFTEFCLSFTLTPLTPSVSDWASITHSFSGGVGDENSDGSVVVQAVSGSSFSTAEANSGGPDFNLGFDLGADIFDTYDSTNGIDFPTDTAPVDENAFDFTGGTFSPAITEMKVEVKFELSAGDSLNGVGILNITPLATSVVPVGAPMVLLATGLMCLVGLRKRS